MRLSLRLSLLLFASFPACGDTSSSSEVLPADVTAAADLTATSTGLDSTGAAADLSQATPPDSPGTSDLTNTAPPDLTNTDLPDLAVPDLAMPDLTAPDLSRSPDLVTFPVGASVLQYHLHASRDGVYTDPKITKAAAKTAHRDLQFTGTLIGPVYAQPLFLDGGAGPDVVYVVTEQDTVYAFDALTGAQKWMVSLGTPVPLNRLPCGNIDPLGITGTPLLDPQARRIYLDAMTTPDGGTTKRHLIFALSIDDGSTVAGWPVDVNATARWNGMTFDSSVQNQRGGLQLLNGILYVPYGGHFGDCGKYHGWLVGVNVSNPTQVKAWATSAQGGGMWSVGGIASDGQSLYGATGNTFNANVWGGGEAQIRFAPGPVFSGLKADYFVPLNWKMLDSGDIDIGGSGPILFHLPGNPAADLIVGLGKDGNAYLIDRTNMGGISSPLAIAHVDSNEIINAGVAYTTAQASYAAFKAAGVACPTGAGGDLTCARLTPGTPPTIKVAWCATMNGAGSPMLTTSDGTAEAIVWAIGAEGDNRLHGFDADTGAIVYKGGGANEVLGTVRRFSTPIAAKGRIYVASDTRLNSFILP